MMRQAERIAVDAELGLSCGDCSRSNTVVPLTLSLCSVSSLKTRGLSTHWIVPIAAVVSRLFQFVGAAARRSRVASVRVRLLGATVGIHCRRSMACNSC